MNEEVRNILNNVRDKVTQKTEENTVTLVNSIKLPKECIDNIIVKDTTIRETILKK